MMPWYERATIFYDWVDHGRDVDADYARHVVQKTLECHCDTLAFCVVVGGYALWDSHLTPRWARMGDCDLIGELSRLCGEHGLRFVPWWLATACGGVERVLREHPGWQLLGPPDENGQQTRHNYICYNSPYRQIVYEEVREVLSGYDVDGIYFDQLPGSCYCAWCRAKFEKRYGRQMPVVEDEFFVYNSAAGLPPLLREFRDDSARSFCAGIRRIVDEVAPDVCYAQNWVRNQQAHLAADYADVLLPEFYQKEDLVPLGLKHRLTKAYFDDGPIWGNVRHSVRHDARHHPVRGTRALLFDCAANMASPLMLDLCAMDFDPTGTEQIAETFDHIRTVQDWQDGAEPVRYAALLHSQRSHELFPDRYDAAFEGLYRLLFERHVPCEIVTEKAVQRGCLEDFNVVVLADVMSMEEVTATALRRAADGGLGVIGTFMTGMLDGNGAKRERAALADLFGVETVDVTAYDTTAGVTADPALNLSDLDSPVFHYGSVRTGHPLTEGIPQESLFAFQGGFSACRPSGDARAVADIHAVDMARLNARPFNRRGIYPGAPRWPLAVVREVNDRRTAYFAPQLESVASRAHAPELDEMLLRATTWAGGPPPIKAPDCPRSVEVRLFRNPESNTYQILLVNLTTNALTRGAGGPGVVRYVTPQRNLRLRLTVPEPVTGVESLVGPDAECRTDRGRAEMVVPELDLYEALRLRCD
jgi:hypothetical protein